MTVSPGFEKIFIASLSMNDYHALSFIIIYVKSVIEEQILHNPVTFLEELL